MTLKNWSPTWAYREWKRRRHEALTPAEEGELAVLEDDLLAALNEGRKPRKWTRPKEDEFRSHYNTARSVGTGVPYGERG